jgi:hypothetical protein
MRRPARLRRARYARPGRSELMTHGSTREYCSGTGTDPSPTSKSSHGYRTLTGERRRELRLRAGLLFA